MDETEPLQQEERFKSLMSSGIASGGETKSSSEHDGLGSRFECNICLEDVREPIVTQCGHLFCWYINSHTRVSVILNLLYLFHPQPIHTNLMTPKLNRSCLYRWLNTNHSTCPLCKAGVTRENVIPLFIRGSGTDPRTRVPEGDVPNRPNAHRPANPNPNNMPGFLNAQNGPNDMATGFGFFPSLFGLQFQSFAVQPPMPGPATADEIQQEFLSRMLIGLGSFVVLCLIIF